jgi:cellulose synthase/poly-beta-1,6-N-acetylglucosamine synthase-like glycosyltransferase
MSHWLIEFTAGALILMTLPGTIELALLTFAALLPGNHEPAKGNEEKREGQDRETGGQERIKRLAVVIPAHNEATTITRCLHSLTQCKRPYAALETSIIVVADNCRDATAELASRSGAKVIERRDSERRGKGFALQFAFGRLLEEGFDAVVVVDADSVVESNLLKEVVRLLNRGADGVQTRYLPLNTDNSARARLRNVALSAFNVLRPLGRSRLGLSCGILGNGFALSRATLQAVAYSAYSIVEDLEYHIRLVRAGFKIEFADRTMVRAEMPTGGEAARTQRVRWEGGRLRMIAQNVPELAREAFLGKPQLLELLLELLLFPLTIHVLLLACTAVVPFTPARIYAVSALALVVGHASLGIIVAGGGFRDFAAILAVPGYLAWKLLLLPATLRSARPGAEWVKTER